MHETLTLTRYRPANPPSKTVAQAQKVKQKVVNSNANRRKQNMTRMTEEQARQKLTADLPKMEAFIAECDESIATLGPDSTMFLSQVEDRADELVREQGIDHGQAMRLTLTEANASGRPSGDTGGMKLVSPGDYGSDYPTRREEDDTLVRPMGEVYGTEEEMREAVERRMKADPDNYRQD